MQSIRCFQFSRGYFQDIKKFNFQKHPVGIQRPIELLNASPGKSRPWCSTNGLIKNPYQLSGVHLVANKKLLEAKLKIKICKLAQGLENQKDLILRSHLLPHFLTRVFISNSRIFFFSQLPTAFTSHLDKIITKTSYKILCKDDDVKRLIFSVCASRKCSSQSNST